MNEFYDDFLMDSLILFLFSQEINGNYNGFTESLVISLKINAQQANLKRIKQSKIKQRHNWIVSS